jgi:hypothetical protein
VCIENERNGAELVSRPVIVWRDEVNGAIQRGLRQDGTFVVGWVVHDIVKDRGCPELHTQ